MTEPIESPPPEPARAAAKKKRSKKPVSARATLPLSIFRGLLEVVQSHHDVLTEEQLRAFDKLLHAFANDADGTVKIGLTPPSPATPRRLRFSNASAPETSMPGDDEIRTLAREIALIDDDAERFRRIDALGGQFLRRASEIFAFKAESVAGMRSGFASAVADIRQMEQIASSGQRKGAKEEETGEPRPHPDYPNTPDGGTTHA
jgi:hypothetical protein